MLSVRSIYATEANGVGTPQCQRAAFTPFKSTADKHGQLAPLHNGRFVFWCLGGNVATPDEGDMTENYYFSWYGGNGGSVLIGSYFDAEGIRRTRYE